MLLELKYIVSYVKGLMSNTEETWQKLAEGKTEESKLEYMMAHYYWPLFGVSAALVMLLIGSGGLFGPGLLQFELEKGMKAMVHFVVVYAVGPMLVALLIDFFFRYTIPIPLTREKVDIFVHYSMSTLMVLDVCCSVFPNLEFLAFSKLYLIYIVAVGVLHFLGIKENKDNAVATVLFCIVFYVSPLLITSLINLFDRL